MRTHPTKIDAWLLALILFTAGACVYASGMLLRNGHLFDGVLAVVTFGLGAVLPCWFLLTTRYTIDATHLHIRSGPMRWTIPLRDIRAVAPSHNPLSSPALSLDRLKISYGQNRFVLVSPKNQAAFLADLGQTLRA